MKTFCVGDIHGAYEALLECLQLSQFDKKRDALICLGDVCDRGLQVKECIDELLTIPRCIYVLGNHDAWALDWATEGKALPEWLQQGGAQTVMSYQNAGMPKPHVQFLSKALHYFVDENRLYVHGGFDPEIPLEETSKEFFLWDRHLLKEAQEVNLLSSDYKFGDYEDVFVGHTPTTKFGKSEPQKFCNVWAMDTGAGWGAKLTIMDVETKQFWQSQPVN